MNEQIKEQLPSNNSWKLLVLVTVLLLTGLGLIWSGLSSTTSEVTQNQLATPTREASGSSQSLGVTGQQAQVSKVIDGDTIEVLIDGESKKVRLIGVDTPETVDPRRPVGCFGKEASDFTKQLLKDKEVLLVKDISEIDKFGRMLRYVYLIDENGQEFFVNDYLVREGFAKVVTFPPDVKYTQQLRQAESEAREQKKGLWGKCQGV